MTGGWFKIVIPTLLFLLNPCPLFPTHTHLTTGRSSFSLYDSGWWTSCAAGKCESWFKCVFGAKLGPRKHINYINGKLFNSFTTFLFNTFQDITPSNSARSVIQKTSPIGTYRNMANLPASNRTSISFTRSTSWLLSALAFLMTCHGSRFPRVATAWWKTKAAKAVFHSDLGDLKPDDCSNFLLKSWLKSYSIIYVYIYIHV